MGKMQAIIEKTSQPITSEMVCQTLVDLGVQNGSVVLVHSAMSQLGFVIGDETGLWNGLLAAVGLEGTVVMPAQTVNNSDPMNWEAPPVPQGWHQQIRDHMPAYNPSRCLPEHMGRLALRMMVEPGVMRSNHPQDSFLAYGSKAAWIVSEQPLEDAFGARSPLAKLEILGAKIVLLGTGFEHCTAMHLAESRTGLLPRIKTGSRVLDVFGQSIWQPFLSYDYDSDDFDACGADFVQTGQVQRAYLGHGLVQVMDLTACVSFAQTWLREHRKTW